MNSYPYPDTSLLVFARAPIAGRCKTRLIPELGEEGAASLQAELIEHCAAQVCDRPLCQTQLWCSPDSSHECFRKLANKYCISLHQQNGADLGERMYQAMVQSDTTYTLIIGTDIPLLTREYVESAITVLRQGADAVIGPAEDGGYVLLGLKQIPKQLFEDIEWGSNRVFQQTCEKMTASGLVWQALEPLWDLDNGQDLRRYKLL